MTDSSYRSKHCIKAKNILLVTTLRCLAPHISSCIQLQYSQAPPSNLAMLVIIITTPESPTSILPDVMWGMQYAHQSKKKQITEATEAAAVHGAQISRNNQNWLVSTSIRFVSISIQLRLVGYELFVSRLCDI
jgi:hypothetical protein